MRAKLQISFITLVLITSFASCQKTNEKDYVPEVAGYPVVSTGQEYFYDNSTMISPPSAGDPFFGQDANYSGNQARYTDNGDGTVTDLVTGLMWQKSFTRMLWADAEENAGYASTGGYTDWRLPDIKELYSLVDFSGNQGTGNPSSNIPPADAVPFIDTEFFEFSYPAVGRYIDVQFISKTTYGGTAMGNENTFFGLNLADGRIKAYPQSGNISDPEFPARFVRGNVSYGVNDYTDNGDGTVTDHATGLMWSMYDSGNEVFETSVSGYTHQDGSMNWEEALHFSENSTFAGYDDWRLPDAKELHTIVDYTRSPDVTNSPAIDPVFETTRIMNELGQEDFPAFWSSTSFNPGSDAVIIFFGRAMGYIDKNDPIGNSNPSFLDVHGAGCQRTDPKTGSPSYGFGPQGDVRRVYNFVRLVRNK